MLLKTTNSNPSDFFIGTKSPSQTMADANGVNVCVINDFFKISIRFTQSESSEVMNLVIDLKYVCR